MTRWRFVVDDGESPRVGQSQHWPLLTYMNWQCCVGALALNGIWCPLRLRKADADRGFHAHAAIVSLLPWTLRCCCTQGFGRGFRLCAVRGPNI